MMLINHFVSKVATPDLFVQLAARVAQSEGIKPNPNNYLLMHAMGPNVAGVIGSAISAGIFLSFFG